MNKAAILIAVFMVLGSLDVARAQLALSSYVCEAALSQSPCIQSSCKPCSSVFISRVLSSDGKVLPYTYSFCSDDGSISLDVGIKEYESHTFFSFNCADNLFVALDPTKSTLAAQFYLHCLDGLIYKCPPGRVFEEKLARCIPAYQPLESGLEYCAKTCGDPVFPIGISAVVCESNLYNTLPPVCSSCYTPYTVPAITTSCEAVPGFYTFCAENGRFSLDIGCENKVHTYFTPYCTGNNPLQPIDASKKSIASKLFWDCRVGLVACEGDYVFDPVRNRCSKSWYSLEAYEYEDVCYKACPAPHFEELYLGGEGVGSKTGASRLQTSSRLSGNALSNFATTGGASIRPGLTGGPAGLFRSAITPGPTAPTARLATPGPTAPTARLATPGPSASASRPATPESTSNPKP